MELDVFLDLLQSQGCSSTAGTNSIDSRDTELKEEVMDEQQTYTVAGLSHSHPTITPIIIKTGTIPAHVYIQSQGCVRKDDIIITDFSDIELKVESMNDQRNDNIPVNKSGSSLILTRSNVIPVAHAFHQSQGRISVAENTPINVFKNIELKQEIMDNQCNDNFLLLNHSYAPLIVRDPEKISVPQTAEAEPSEVTREKYKSAYDKAQSKDVNLYEYFTMNDIKNMSDSQISAYRNQIRNQWGLQYLGLSSVTPVAVHPKLIQKSEMRHSIVNLATFTENKDCLPAVCNPSVFSLKKSEIIKTNQLVRSSHVFPDREVKEKKRPFYSLTTFYPRNNSYKQSIESSASDNSKRSKQSDVLPVNSPHVRYTKKELFNDVSILCPVLHYFKNNTSTTSLVVISTPDQRNVKNMLFDGTDEMRLTGEKSLTGGTCVTGGTCLTGGTFLTGGTCLNGPTCHTGEKHRTGEPSDTGETHHTGVTRHTGETRHTGKTRDAGETRYAGKTHHAGETCHTGETRHTGETCRLHCTLCSYQCNHIDKLSVHMHRHAGDEKPHACNTCSYTCNRRDLLVAHMLVHSGEKPFTCTLCPYRSTKKSNLVVHMRTHTNEKPFACTTCSYRCAQKSHLVTHMCTHSGEKPYVCTFCSYRCPQKITLVVHMRTHSGEKPYACTFCSYRCAQKGTLVVHLRTHTGEKPHACATCSNCFTSSSSLSSHMSTHISEKPFACAICAYQCKHNSDLSRHMRRHK